MAMNISQALRSIQRLQCFRAGNTAVVQRTGRVVMDDLQRLLDRGYVKVNSHNGHLTLTLAGIKAVPQSASPQSMSRARKFLRAHVNFIMIGDRLVAGNGTGSGITRYLAEFFIDDGTLVLNENGRYVLAKHTITISGDIYPAVMAFVEMLERARDRRDI